MSTAVRRGYDAAAVVIPADNEREIERFEAAGHRIHRGTNLSVITSKRIQARDPYGFADYLTQLGRTAAGDCA